ncbi:putative glycosyltransferase (plasmid) [Rhodococcus opacus B4]|uniref:Putative glycosyltransferase n=2 Tax=Rhodococcus opacus TaxID=37919 RepID=C1BED6_RHOOB|nr:glycosyltransferase family 4 protein [Rhodococcus opacus]BAH56176.1 putative glycosyltransferase [Rhodococcus opacus B4]
MNNQRIAIVVPAIEGGGAEVVARKWAEALGHRDHRVDVITTHRVPSAPVTGFNLVPLTPPKSGVIAAVRALKATFETGRYDTVVSLLTFSNLLCLLAASLMRQSRPRIIISEHTLHSHRRAEYGVNMRGQQRLARLLYRYADGWIAPSHAVAAEMTTAYHLDNKKMWVVPNPVAFDAPSQEPDYYKRPPNAPLRLVFVGRILAPKRPELVLDIAAHLTSSWGEPVVVDFIGDGDLRPQLSAMAANHPFPVNFHGWVDQWHKHCEPGSVLVVPSPIEGFGNVLIEAASAGIPVVVSSRCLGAADACIPGVTGQLISDDSVPSFSAAIRKASFARTAEVQAWLNRFTIESAAELLHLAVSGSADKITPSPQAGNQPTKTVAGGKTK